MPYASKVVLKLPIQDRTLLADFVEACLRDHVELLCVSGDGSDAVEDEIDALIYGDGSDDARFIVTTSHKDEPLEDVIEFATNWAGDGADGEPPSVVRL